MTRLFLKLTVSAAVIIAAAVLTIRLMTNGSIVRPLIAGAAVAFLLAVVLAALFTRALSHRYKRISDFAESISRGDYQVRIVDQHDDDLGYAATALNRTAEQLEKDFSALEMRRDELETLLNSMQDPVVAVARDRKIAWVN